jgi:DNA-binding IclR family transcriptional regulator
VEGPSAIRVATLRIGSRRPLGLGAGGLAILSALPDQARENVLAEILPQVRSGWDFPAPALLRSIDDARRLGYSLIRNRVTPGVTAIGMPFHSSTGRTAGAVSLAAVNSRMGGSRVAMLASLLRQAVKEIEAGLRSGYAFRAP